MYAVFKKNKFVTLCSPDDIDKYEINSLFMIYRLDNKDYKYPLEHYKFFIDFKGNILAALQDSIIDHLDKGYKKGYSLGYNSCQLQFYDLSFLQKLKFLFKGKP